MRRFVALLVSSLLLIAGCGSDSDADTAEQTATTSDSGGDSGELTGVEVSGEPGEQPTVEIADPPFTVEQTTTEVVAEGDAPEVQESDQAVVKYVVVNGRNGEELESSWSAGTEPVTFPLEPGGLIQGLLDGLIGQSYGSRVLLAIPPEDGFGPDGNPQLGVEADDTLVFVIDLIEAAPAPEPAPELPADAPSIAEGEPREAPEGLPTLQLDDQGQPTGFAATGSVPQEVKELVAAPVIVGDGPELAEGDTAFVQYVGQLWPDGKIFDESWSRGEPVPFPLEQAGLIQGFLDGLIGQTVGSRVIIAIPSDLAYGPGGQPPDIGPDADLIFVVDVLAAV